MESKATGQFSEHFRDLSDPRMERTKLHKLIDIVMIAICAVICGADDWVEVAMFGEAKEGWFRRFLIPTSIAQIPGILATQKAASTSGKRFLMFLIRKLPPISKHQSEFAPLRSPSIG